MTGRDGPGLRARLLAPLGALRARAAARRMRGDALWRAPHPVIAVDSLTGEDDHVAALVTALAMRLRDRGLSPALLLRGTGGRDAGPLAVDLRAHAAADVGDAALLAAAFAPTWVAADRVAGARALTAAGAGDCVVMEGGLRDPALHTDLAILVVDAARGFGNGRCRPAGPMRAPLGPGLARADLVVSVGERAAQAAFAGPGARGSPCRGQPPGWSRSGPAWTGAGCGCWPLPAPRIARDSSRRCATSERPPCAR